MLNTEHQLMFITVIIGKRREWTKEKKIRNEKWKKKKFEIHSQELQKKRRTEP